MYGMDLGLIAIIIILIVMTGAIKTKRCIEFMIVGGILSAIVIYKSDFITGWTNVFLEVMYSEDSVWLVLICGFFGAFIALLQESKGTYGFVRIIQKFCNSEKKSLLTAFILGILIFIDDYLNIMTIGSCMKKVFDKNKMPRESLAYVIDSTAAPVCTIVPFSSWAVFFAALFFQEESVLDLGFTSEMSAYLAAIPFAFYPIFTVIIVALFSFGLIPKIGGMKKAYDRVATTGKVYSDSSRRFNQEEEYIGDGNLLDFILPMALVIILSISSGDMLFSIMVTVIATFFLYVPRKVVKIDDFVNLIIKGFCDMLPTVAIVLMGYMLENFLSQMGLTEFIINNFAPILTPVLLPAGIFLLVAAITFTTGSNWGMSAVAIPIVFPLAASIDANIILTMAAVMSGGAFGSHACFYSDANLLTSATCGIDNFEHAGTQLPYVLIASGLSTIAFIISALVL